MIDKEVAMQHHVHNLKKSANLTGNGTVRYEYLLSAEQLYRTMNDQVADLNYPLRKEVKRDRFVVNSQALREAIQKGSSQALNEFQHDIYMFIQNNVNPLIEKSAYDIFNSVFSLASAPTNSIAEQTAYKLGATFGLAIGNTISDIVEDMIIPK